MKTFSALAFSALLAMAASSPVTRRAIVAHDSIIPQPQTVQDGNVGNAIALYNPSLHIAHGCQPYSAVDASGNISGGLNPSGSPSGGCRDQTKAQTYARAGTVDGKPVIMYAWYMPKDQPRDDSIGAHRHDWENVVLFLDSFNSTSPILVSGAASGHGNYKTTTSPQRYNDTVKVEYFTNFPTNHELQFTDTVGVVHDVWDWDTMNNATQTALNTADFGKADVPFRDSNFETNVRKAFI